VLDGREFFDPSGAIAWDPCVSLVGGLPFAVFAKGGSALPLCFLCSSDLAEACRDSGRQFTHACKEKTKVLGFDSVLAAGDTTRVATADALRNS
jgi:hypothetical protein